MILKIAYYGHPILRKKTEAIKEISPKIRQLVSDMFETMYASDGIGLAAPQIFDSISLFVTCVPMFENENNEKPKPGVERVFINPKILSYSDESCTELEGCLSIPQIRGHVTRPCSIVVEAMDLEGKVFTQEFEDYEARCIMHENDHINGKLFIDRLDAEERKEIEPKLREIKKKFK
jgi:peptide deformylase